MMNKWGSRNRRGADELTIPNRNCHHQRKEAINHQKTGPRKKNLKTKRRKGMVITGRNGRGNLISNPTNRAVEWRRRRPRRTPPANRTEELLGWDRIEPTTNEGGTHRPAHPPAGLLICDGGLANLPFGDRPSSSPSLCEERKREGGRGLGGEASEPAADRPPRDFRTGPLDLGRREAILGRSIWTRAARCEILSSSCACRLRRRTVGSPNFY
jgi:hypothetical protein